jgi:hypothetical protein
MNWIALACLITAFTDNTITNIDHGTIGVVYFTDQKIVIAADSRGFVYRTGKEDDDCKIFALGDKVLFFSSGTVIVETVEHRVISTDKEARSVYTKVVGEHQGRIDGYVEDVADEWAAAMKSDWQSLYSPLDRISVPSIAAHRQLPVAIFAGRTVNGDLCLFTVILGFKDGKMTSEVIHTTRCYNDFCAYGSVDTAFEFSQMTTDRAKKDAATWKPPKGSKPDDLDILKTMHFVQLAIKYQKDVGGPVDAVQLSRDGAIRWFARKKNCPAD